MQQVVADANFEAAWKNVKRNRGAPGPDGITIAEFPAWFRPRWQSIRLQLLDGTYRPDPVRRKTIDKPRWRQTFAWYSKRDRPSDPTGHPTSLDPDLRSVIQ